MFSARKRALLILVFFVASGSLAQAHGFSRPPALSQPASPVQLESCYLGTDFLFGDPKLASEETKMQLSADLAKPVPAEYRMLGLRFQFGSQVGKRNADVIVFTGSQETNPNNVMDTAPPGLNPSAYLPRVPNYFDYRCGVDFATSLDWKDSWFDTGSDVVACKAPVPMPESSTVWLSALELQRTSSDAVFLMVKRQAAVYWTVDGGAVQLAKPDQFGRAVVALGGLSRSAHTLTFGPAATNLDSQVCFHPFSTA